MGIDLISIRESSRQIKIKTNHFFFEREQPLKADLAP